MNEVSNKQTPMTSDQLSNTSACQPWMEQRSIISACHDLKNWFYIIQ
ncbi:MAG: hypothetical protein KOO66_13845 [Bacteroidales bacterium]|nr:hypothetical protein [Bacteroidales bacterium]